MTRWQCGNCGTYNKGNDLSAACHICGLRGDGTYEDHKQLEYRIGAFISPDHLVGGTNRFGQPNLQNLPIPVRTEFGRELRRAKDARLASKREQLRQMYGGGDDMPLMKFKRLIEVRDLARKVCNDYTASGELDQRSALMVAQEMGDLDDKVLGRIDSLLLSRIVYEQVRNGVETFEEQNIGADLAYLLGAIVRNTVVEWERPDLPELHRVLAGIFPLDHPVWGFIAVAEGDDRTAHGNL